MEIHQKEESELEVSDEFDFNDSENMLQFKVVTKLKTLLSCLFYISFYKGNIDFLI